jgi:hypothetical protein
MMIASMWTRLRVALAVALFVAGGSAFAGPPAKPLRVEHPAAACEKGDRVIFPCGTKEFLLALCQQPKRLPELRVAYPAGQGMHHAWRREAIVPNSVSHFVEGYGAKSSAGWLAMRTDTSVVLIDYSAGVYDGSGATVSLRDRTNTRYAAQDALDCDPVSVEWDVMDEAGGALTGLAPARR